ncbi:MICOS complex subunit MIC13 [Erpetoichthys calabaricus]|uniref:MICOS complex subunit MIC13 n=1 Tax=Erpetoichthys calabaricus TaxID=27687 RepID=A0A8C4TE82_ERPCA|nr:MICOS complex subunit MIC13 [Erpetoichthys calabaricus]
MAPRIFPFVKLMTKFGIAGGAVYLTYSQGLLEGNVKGSEVLSKAKSAIPPAVEEWTKYFGWELPSAPKIDFSPTEMWNSGVHMSVSALSVAPTRACEYTHQGWQYLKNLAK